MNPDNPTPEANVTLLIVSDINVTVYPETCEGTVTVIGAAFCNNTVAPLWVELNEKLPVSTSNENSESVTDIERMARALKKLGYVNKFNIIKNIQEIQKEKSTDQSQTTFSGSN